MPNKHIPHRRCIGCMESKPQAELIRIAYSNTPAVDVSGAAQGRGMYICRSKGCLELAVKRKSLQRASKGSVVGSTLNQIVNDLEKIIESDFA